jgi:hypothetical protein
MTRRGKAFFFILPAILLIMLLSAGISEAITLSVAPNPVTIGQTVTATVTASYPFSAIGPCGVRIQFSASDPFTNIGICTSPCNVTHTYSNPGSYTVTAEAVPPPLIGGCVSASAPSPVSTNVTVNCPALSYTSPNNLPNAYVNQMYSYQMQTSGGVAPISFSSTDPFPPGLSMNSSGLISGVLTYRTTTTPLILATDSCDPPQFRSDFFTISAFCPSMNITTASLPAATVNQSYSALLQASGGIPPYSFSVLPPFGGECTSDCCGGMLLPAGLFLSSSGVLSGIPTALGTYSLCIRVTGSCPGGPGNTNKSLSLSINCPSFSNASGSPSGGTVGQTYSFQYTMSGGVSPYTFSLTSGSLPPGLNLSSAGLISGTATTAGTYNYVLTVNQNCSGSSPITVSGSITINAACPALSISSPSTLTSGTVGSGYSYQIPISGGQAPFTYSIVSGSLPSEMNMSSAGLITGTPSAPGTWNFTVRVTDSCVAGGRISKKSFSDKGLSLTINPASCPALSITSPPTITNGIVNQSYTYQFTTSGGQSPIAFSIVSGPLPSGLNLNSLGLISGTPTTTGIFNFTIQATDSCAGGAQTAQQAFSLTINPQPCSPLSITSPPALSNGIVNQGYTYQLNTSGGQVPINFSVVGGALPTGLNMSSTGLITGLPSGSGTYNFTVQAIDSCAGGAQRASRDFSITINPQPCPPLNITSPPTLSTGTINQAYSYQLSATGGEVPVSFSILSGSLPSGMNMSSAGLISGMPTVAGTSNFTVRATDSCRAGAQTVDRAFSLTINPASCPALSITSPSTLTVGTAEQWYSYQITTTGGQSPIVFSLASGSLPSGVSITPGGMISGAPKRAGTYSFTVQATDSCAGGQQNAQRAFTLTINPQASQPCTPLKITSLSLLTTGMVNQPYSYQTQSSGGQAPITFSLASGTLPIGLSLNSAGLISGTPNAPGNYSFAVMATDSCPAGAQNTVQSAALSGNPCCSCCSLII